MKDSDFTLNDFVRLVKIFEQLTTCFCLIDVYSSLIGTLFIINEGENEPPMPLFEFDNIPDACNLLLNEITKIRSKLHSTINLINLHHANFKIYSC